MNNRVGLPRHDRKWEILRSMAFPTMDGTPAQWWTLLEIARENKMKPSKHLRELLAELAYGKHIVVRHGEGKNHGLRLEYMLNMDAPVTTEFADEWHAFCIDRGA